MFALLAALLLAASPAVGQTAAQRAELDRARRAASGGDAAGALEILDALIPKLPAKTPTEQLYAAQARVLRGVTLARLPDYAKAEAELGRAADAAETVSDGLSDASLLQAAARIRLEALANRGDYLARLGRYAEAEAVLRAAIDLPHPPPAATPASAARARQLVELSLRARVARAELAESTRGQKAFESAIALAREYADSPAGRDALTGPAGSGFRARLDALAGRLATVRRRDDDAAAAYESALKHIDEHPEALRSYASALRVSLAAVLLTTEGANAADVRRAADLLDKALEEIGKGDGARLDRALAHRYRAVARALGDDAAGAWEELEESGRLLDAAGLPADHAERAVLANWEGTLAAREGRWQVAGARFDAARRLLRQDAARVLVSRPDAEQRAFLHDKDRDLWLPAALSAALARPDAPGVATRSFEWCVNGKGLLLPVRAERYRLARDDAGGANGKALRDGVRDLARLAYSPGVTTAEADAALTRYRAAAEAVARAAPTPGPARWFTADDVRARLGPDEAFVEITRFARRDPGDVSRRAGELHYAAWVLTADAGPALVPLGPAGPIDAAVEEAARQMAASTYKDDEGNLIPRKVRDAEPATRAAFGRLYRLVVVPLLPQAGGRKHWIVSPDGDLWRVPLAAFHDGTDYLVRTRAVTLVFSGREVAERPAAPDALKSAAVFGDIEYTVEKKKSDFLSNFPKLKDGAEAMVDVRAALARARPECVTGRAATERAVRAALARRPDVVHLHTHGFYRPKEIGPGKTGELAEEPFLCAGVLLAGAHDRDRDAPPDDDGLILGSELLLLDLRGVGLVSLSACETADGELSKEGEAVQSLQYAVRLAGARRVLSTLFEVPALTNSWVQNDFYDGLSNDVPAHEALRAAQAAALDRCKSKRDGFPRLEHPFLWASAVLSGL